MQLMGLAPVNVASPNFPAIPIRKRQTKSDEYAYNKISHTRLTTEKSVQKGCEALEKRLFFLLITQYEKIFIVSNQIAANKFSILMSFLFYLVR